MDYAPALCVDYIMVMLAACTANTYIVVNINIACMPTSGSDAYDPLACPACWETMSNPVYFACGHDMCKSCWLQCKDARCPLCRGDATSARQSNALTAICWRQQQSESLTTAGLPEHLQWAVKVVPGPEAVTGSSPHWCWRLRKRQRIMVSPNEV